MTLLKSGNHPIPSMLQADYMKVKRLESARFECFFFAHIIVAEKIKKRLNFDSIENNVGISEVLVLSFTCIFDTFR